MPVGTRIVLRGEYDIWRRDELRAQLERVDPAHGVTIDMTATTLIDAGSAALLMALQRRVQQCNPKARVTLLNAPRIVRRVLRLCGAGGLFDFTPER